MTKEDELAEKNYQEQAEEVQKKFDDPVAYWKDTDPIEPFLEELKESKRNYSKRFGANVKRYREQQGLTLEEVAQKLKISAPALKQIENGSRAEIKEEYVYQLASILSCTPDNLLDRAFKTGYILVEKGERSNHSNKSDQNIHVSQEEIKPPFLPRDKYAECLNEINEGLFLVLKKHQGLYKVLICLLKARNPSIYGRLENLLWGAFEKELEEMGLSK